MVRIIDDRCQPPAKKVFLAKISLVFKIFSHGISKILPAIDAELSNIKMLNHHSVATCLKAEGTQDITISLTYLWKNKH